MNAATKFTLAFTIAAGLGAGSVATYYALRPDNKDSIKTEELNKPPAAPTVKKLFNEAGIEARILQVYCDSIVDVAMHPWVGEYELARIAIKGSSAAATADAVAVITDSLRQETAELSVGQKVFLQALERKSIGQTRNIPLVSPSKDIVTGPVRAHVTRLIDGDTFEAVADIGGGNYIVTHVRVGGIDTPEKKGRADCPEEAALAAKASALTESLISGKDVMLTNIQFEKYGGRVLSDVGLPNGESLAQILVKNGYARPYDGGKKQSWCGL